MKRLLVAIFILLILGAGGGYYYLSQKVAKAPPVPAYVQQAENALAMEGAVMLGHVNVEHAVQIEKLIFGKADPFPMLSKMRESKDTPFLTALEKNGINVKNSIHHALGGFFVTPQAQGGALILYGAFSPAAIIKSIGDAGMITANDNGFITFSYKDTKTCKVSDQKQAYVTADRVVIAAPEVMSLLLGRLDNNAPAQIDLTAWNAFREGRLASVGLLMPKETAKALSGGLTKMMAQRALQEKGQTLENVFIGAAIQTGTSSGLTLDAVLKTSDATWPQATADVIAEKREELRTKAAGKMPSLTKLDKYLSVSAQANTLNMSLTFNKDMLQDAENIVQEVIGGMFSNIGMSMNRGGNAGADQILSEDEKAKFINGYAHNMLLPYNQKDHHFMVADTSTGPFGIMVEKAGLTEKDGKKMTEITLKVKTGEIQNIPTESLHFSKAEKSPATLTLTGIFDAQGVNLVATETCGSDRNNDLAALSVQTGYNYKDGKNMPYTYLEGKKAVRLKTGATLDDIARIDGYITLHLPNDVQRKVLKAPLEDQVVETDDVRVFFKDGGKSTLKYDISGQNNHVLAIYALNSKEQALKSNGGSASASMGRRSISRSVQGSLDGAEILYTTGTTAKNYTFSATTFLNHFKEETYGKKPQIVQPDTRKEFAAISRIYNFSKFCDAKDVAYAIPPLQLCLRGVKYYGKSWGANTRLSLAAPASKGLNGNISGFEIVIGGYKTKQGNVKLLDHQFAITDLNTYPQDKPPYLKAQNISFRTADPEEALKGKDIVSVIGKVNVSLPRGLANRGMHATTLGSSMETKDRSMSLSVHEVSHNKITLEVKGDMSKLVQILPLSAEKKMLIVNSTRFEQKKDRENPENIRNFLEIEPVGGQPKFFNVIYATKTDVIPFPFDIPVEKPEQKQP